MGKRRGPHAGAVVRQPDGESAEENQRNPWRAERIGMLADMEERLGKAIPDILTLVDMHPEMSIEEFTAFVAGTLQPT
jgi:hypothetical protein